MGNNEEALVKIIRLLANITTEEKYTSKHLKLHQSTVQQYVDLLLAVLAKKSLSHNEEFILNAISCITNILFYDVPSQPLISEETRIVLFKQLNQFILATQNEEVQIEAVRVLSNLSRHAALCAEFVSDKNFVEALTIVLDHTLRDLVFYAIGIIINITLHKDSRPKIIEKGVISKLIEVLKDANIEDIDLSKVSAKALHNMVEENNYWNLDLINKLDAVLTSLGEELDSIMVINILKSFCRMWLMRPKPKS